MLRLLAFACLAAATANAADWPQFLGPHRDGTSAETNLAAVWPADGPPVVWKAPVGRGFGGPVLAEGRVILHHRRDDAEVIEAFAVADGKPLWKHAYPATYRDDFGFDDGPRATPTVVSNRVFAFGAAGVLTCVDAATGARRWQADCAKELGADKGFFGFACSPLVMDGAVLVNVGGRDGAGIAAHDADSGRLRWKATDDAAGYAAPVAAELGGKPAAVFFTRAGLAVLDPADGTVRGTFPWRSREHASVNAAAPIVAGGRIFLTASYDTGAVLLDWREGRPRPVWQGDDILSAHYGSPVRRGEFLFGFDGRQERGARLRCVEWATGRVRWTQEGLGAGAVLVAGDRLLVLSERGELILAPASPAGFQPAARAQILGSDTRAMPALADGVLYARDKRQLVAVRLGPGRN